MAQQKLYTEEQVKQIFENLSVSSGYDYNMETYCDSITPIELPSDEEIEERSKFLFPIENTVSGPTYIAHKSFIEGAKWMKEQILGKEDKTFKQKSKWTKVDNMTRRLK